MMNSILNRTLKRLLIPVSLALMVATAIPAAGQTLHTVVGERVDAGEKHVKPSEEELDRLLAEDEELACLKAEHELKEQKLVDDELVPMGRVYTTSHSGALHFMTFISPDAAFVHLEDGSIWQVRGHDRYKLLDWLPEDGLIITHNSSWWGRLIAGYPYTIRNLAIGKIIEVDLVEGPFYNGVFSHWLIDIDNENHLATLEDGTVWKIAKSGRSRFKKWMVNDTVIIGVNRGWFRKSYNNFLINVNTYKSKGSDVKAQNLTIQ